MPMTPKEMIRFLKKNGFKKVGQNGSHIKMKNSKTGHTYNIAGQRVEKNYKGIVIVDGKKMIRK